jgi:hypothetical protein
MFLVGNFWSLDREKKHYEHDYREWEINYNFRDQWCSTQRLEKSHLVETSKVLKRG